MKRTLRIGLGCFAATVTAWPMAEAQAQSTNCHALVGQDIGGRIVSARYLAAGEKIAINISLSPTPDLNAPLPMSTCQVKAQLSPVPGSHINVEIWLPEMWNGKFVATGGGGFNGGLSMTTLTFMPLVAEGYSAAATDVGHAYSADAQWAFRHPVQLEDFAHRGNHVTAMFSKALIAKYYARPVRRSYFTGCSNGGRDALMEAWRYPTDYDAIIAGAPAAPLTRNMVFHARILEALAHLPGGKPLPDET
jgi:feruloyl esterase